MAQYPQPKKTLETWHLYPEPHVSAEIKRLAKEEMRTIKNMVMVLLTEALTARCDNNGRRRSK
jgi:hypothetical protein